MCLSLHAGLYMALLFPFVFKHVGTIVFSPFFFELYFSDVLNFDKKVVLN